MSRLLVDTSAYAAFFRGHPGVVAALRGASEIVLTPIVLGELRSGFLKGGKARQNEQQLDEFLASPRCSVVVIDEETAHRYSVIHDYLRRQGTPVAPNDLWIAATALAHDLTLLTADYRQAALPVLRATLAG